MCRPGQVDELLGDALNKARHLAAGLIEIQRIVYTNNHYYSDTTAKLDAIAQQVCACAAPVRLA